MFNGGYPGYKISTFRLPCQHGPDTQVNRKEQRREKAKVCLRQPYFYLFLCLLFANSLPDLLIIIFIIYSYYYHYYYYLSFANSLPDL